MYGVQEILNGQIVTITNDKYVHGHILCVNYYYYEYTTQGGHLLYFYSIMSIHWVQKCTLNTDQIFTKLRPFSPTTSKKNTTIH